MKSRSVQLNSRENVSKSKLSPEIEILINHLHMESFIDE